MVKLFVARWEIETEENSDALAMKLNLRFPSPQQVSVEFEQETEALEFALPWELLRDPEGTYLCHENPRISIRRRFAKTGGGRKPFKVKAKEKLRLLYIISRPKDAGFIDPRGESQGGF